ncbi:Nedd4 e3 ubiquitin-protein ligase wwp1 [Globisporangium polare]
MQGYLSAIIVIGAFVAFYGFIYLTALIMKWSSNLDGDDDANDLNAPLVDGDQGHRLDAAIREAEQTHAACKLCGFANFQTSPVCSVCGEPLPAVPAASDVEKKSSKKTKKTGAHEVVEIVKRVDLPRTRRQERARKRKEWVRKIDADEKLVWARDTSNGVDLRFPGYALTFHDEEQAQVVLAPVPEDAPTTTVTATPEVEIVVHPTEAGVPEPVRIYVDTSSGAETRAHGVDHGTTEDGREENTVKVNLLSMKERSQELNSLAKATKLQLTDASAADASLLPIARASNANLQWHDILEIASRVFPSKHAHFVTTTASMIVPAEREVIKLNVHRDHLFEDSIESLSVIPESSIHSVMRISFVDEAGIDAGGLQREWFVLLNERLADPLSGVFKCTNKEEQAYFLNSNSLHDIGENHLTYYFAAGRLIGRALLEGSVIGFHLSLPLLKMILGLPITFSDLEHFDPELYKNLLWIMDNNGVDALGLDFSVTEQRGDEVVVIDLIPNGRSIDLTDDNKDEYLERRFRYLLFESVSSQLGAFLKGLYEVIPQELLMLFDPEEFDYLLCGSDEIDVDDWEKHTKSSSNLKEHPALIWFWELVREMPNEYRQRLLHFATGSSRVPIAGFRTLTSYDGRLCLFTLKGVPLKDDGYIWSHACFNRLDLPLHVVRRDLKAVLYATLDTDMYGFTTD